MDLAWMAWTWQTVIFFVFLVLSIVTLGIWEYFDPGGGPRRGVLGLNTTRGDRLFLSYLGSGFIFLIWIFFFTSGLWFVLILMGIYAILVFRYV